MKLPDSPWIRRLPLLVVALIGIFFFLPQIPHDVEVDYDLGRAAKGLQTLDIEILAPDGSRLHRSVFNVPEKHAVQHLRLKKGDYRAELELRYADRLERRARSFVVADDPRVDLDVEQP